MTTTLRTTPAGFKILKFRHCENRRHYKQAHLKKIKLNFVTITSLKGWRAKWGHFSLLYHMPLTHKIIKEKKDHYLII